MVEGANAALLDIDFGILAATALSGQLTWPRFLWKIVGMLAEFAWLPLRLKRQPGLCWPYVVLSRSCDGTLVAREMGLLNFAKRNLVAGRRLFAAQVPKTVEPPSQAYPLAYGRVEETVMSPFKGGPVYLWLRSTIVWLRRVPGRHWIRWLERNWDYQKMCLMGMPEIHIDPTKNRWRYYIDTSYYGGMLDKSHEDFYRYIMMYPTLAFFFHCVWCRIKDNDKDNFLAKWRVPADEA